LLLPATAGHSTGPVLLRFFSDSPKVFDDVACLPLQILKVVEAEFIIFNGLQVAGDGAGLLLRHLNSPWPVTGDSRRPRLSYTVTQS